MISDKFFLIANLFIFAILIANRFYFFTESLENYSNISLKFTLVNTKKNKKKLENVTIYNYFFSILVALFLLMFVIGSIFIKNKIFPEKKR